MAMTYTSLTGAKTVTGSIRAQVNNATVEAETVLEDAEAYLNIRLRAREMLTTATGTATAGASSIDLPFGFRAGVKLEFIAPTNVILVPKTIEDVEAARFYYSTTGLIGTSIPGIYAALGTVAQFPSALDQNYGYRYVFYRDMPTLGTATETTWLTVKSPRTIRAMCNAYAYEWLRNAPQQQYWLEIAEQMVDLVNAESSSELIGLDLGMSSG